MSESQTIQCATTSAAQTQAIGRTIGRKALSGDVIALIGDLGAGKTQMVRGMAEGMGLEPAHVSSPTFVLMQEYEEDDASVTDGRPSVLVHIDAYRLNQAGELVGLGWSPDTEGPGELADNAVVVIEWADRVADALGADRLEIRLIHAGDNSRDITLTPYGHWVGRLLASDLPDLS